MKSQIKAFPSARHHKVVENISRGMVACGSADDAEAYLIRHLNIHWDRLEAFGVGDDEIEADCHRFAHSAWRQYDQFIRAGEVSA